MKHTLLPFLLTPLSLIACSDIALHNSCVDEVDGFDIEEASVLEDAQSYPLMRDAIVLEYDDSDLRESESWRVLSVDALAMIPASQFAGFPDTYEAMVEVWDADNPLQAEAWTISQTLVRDDLNWSQVTLEDPAEATENDQWRAWWTFDFADVIPETGMSSSTYLVGVRWGGFDQMPLGYSNFNRGCDKNWTDYNNGQGFVLNSDNSPGQDVNSCSWPMLRVRIERRSNEEDCEERWANSSGN